MKRYSGSIILNLSKYIKIDVIKNMGEIFECEFASEYKDP